MDVPLLSIIVINYNGAEYITNCLESLKTLSYPNKEIILIDNNSKDNSIEIVRTSLPEVKIIKNKKNLGFAKGANLGIKLSRGEYIAILNNDIEVDKDWASGLITHLIYYKDIAACSSKILMLDDRKIICNAGGQMDILGYGYDRGMYEQDNAQYDVISEQIFATGAAMIIKKSLLNEIGYFDEKFFMYHEDVDWGWRAWLFGYRILYIPTLLAYHKFEASSKLYLRRDAKAYYGDRYRIRSLLKNYDYKTLIKIAKKLLNRQLLYIIKKPQSLFNITWNILQLPDTIRERRKIQSRRKRSDADLSYLLVEK
jgi:hypothetical protein